VTTSKAAIKSYLNRDLDSYLWMKRLLREEILAELARFPVPPQFKTEPWLHQLVCFYIGLCNPRFLYLLDMGLGKSKILLDLITQAQREKKLRRALITVPRLVNIDSWLDDIGRHSNLEPTAAMVEDIEAKREALLNPSGDLTVIDYQGLQWALCKKAASKKGNVLVPDEKLVGMAQKLYSFIGVDESHKLKNHTSLWFGLMSRLTSTADRVYATTGTLFGTSVEDIWAQFFLVDRGETFGDSLGLFRASFFTAKMNPWKGIEYTYTKSMTRPLNRMLQHRSIRYDDDEIDEIELPKRMPPIVIRLDMGEEQREHYLRALEGVINAGDDPKALEAPWIRMRQITSGYLKWHDEYGDHTVHFPQNPKLDALERLLDEMGDSKVVIPYVYTESGSIISKRLTKLGIDHEWFYGGTKDKPASRRRFMEDKKCRAFVMNAESGGTGNDGLQKVARCMVFYESPPVVTRTQTEKRIHRPGQSERTYFYDLVLRKTVDQGILNDLKDGRDLYQSVVSASKNERKKLLFEG
jgi:SNF2 family DNA or RNA helicase